MTIQLTQEEINFALFELPKGVDIDELLDELEINELEPFRIPHNILLLEHENIHYQLTSARNLASWGVDEGFKKLVYFIDNPSVVENQIIHRLRGHDETFRHILRAVKYYWLTKCEEKQEFLKIKPLVFKAIFAIIELSFSRDFDITGLYCYIQQNNSYEFIPYIKKYLEIKIQNSNDYYWYIHDTIKLLMIFEPKFVCDLLKNHDRTFDDFGLKY